MCPPAGESMSWHDPHIVALSFCASSWKVEYVDACAGFATRRSDPDLASHHEVVREVDGRVVCARMPTESIEWQKKQVTPL